MLAFYSYLYTVTSAHMWLLKNLSFFVKNVIIVKHNTSAVGTTCPIVLVHCFLNYLRECQFFKEIVIFQKSDPFFVLFQTARTLLILTLHWKAMLFWKCLYPYYNFKWLVWQLKLKLCSGIPTNSSHSMTTQAWVARERNCVMCSPFVSLANINVE